MQLCSRFNPYLDKSEKATIINRFIHANFNFCPLVWYFCPCNSAEKIEKVQKRYLRILPNDYESDYDTLLEKCGKSTMGVKCLRILGIELFKTINNTNPKFMKDIVKPESDAKIRRFDTIVNARKTTKFENKSLTAFGPKIWTHLPTEIKRETSLLRFKEYIKASFGPESKCNACRTII